MKKRSTASLWAILVVGTGLAIGSAWTSFAEFMPLLQTGVTAETNTRALVQAAVRPGPSTRSQLLVLNACNDALSSMVGATLGREDRPRLLDHCDQIARSILADSPTHSLAWYITGLVAEGRGDEVQIEAGIVGSQQMAPNQGWLALSRAILAERHYTMFSAAGLAAFDDDIALLVRSERGVAWLGERFLADQTLGTHIQNIVQTLPDDQQRRFLGAVRRQNQQ